MSLNLHNVTLSLQSLGTVFLVFMQGKKEDIERMYYSFYNHGATDAELQEMCDTCAYIVIHGNGDGEIADSKLFRAMTFAALSEILNSENTKGTNPLDRAMDIAAKRIDNMDKVSWYKAPQYTTEFYSMGDSVKAEKPTGNFDSDVLGEVVSRGEEISERNGRLVEYQEDASTFSDEEPAETCKGAVFYDKTPPKAFFQPTK